MLLAREDQAVKEGAAAAARQAVVEILSAVEQRATVRRLEELAWKAALELGRTLMTAALGEMCAQATERDLVSSPTLFDRRGPEFVRDAVRPISRSAGSRSRLEDVDGKREAGAIG